MSIKNSMSLRKLVPQKVINYLKHMPLSVLALIFYRFPSKKLKVIGVTGTDGKTTTVNLIYHILLESGYRAAMVSTVSAKINDEVIDTGFHVTAPDPWLLQKLLRRMVKEKIEYAVLEVTSHGLDQFRLLGIDFEAGVITNITHEHLDYHKNFENYRQAKTKLLLGSRRVVLNADDNSFDYLKNKLKGKKVVTYGLKNESDFSLKELDFKTKLEGEYNQYNCLAAMAAGSLLGIDQGNIKKALETFQGVEGRRQKIETSENFRVIVDFAHTPNALEQLLKSLKKELSGKGRLIAVFGSAGLRDKRKRPMMGEIAGRWADLVVLTAEDPRTEKVEDICGEIALGCQKVNCAPKTITNRAEAIEFAVNEARKGDIVVMAGKGHEKSMCYGKKEYFWSDVEASKKALNNRKEKQ